jgi:uncharacterized surface protein with fasciclin (FAS1) repeats
MNVRALRCGFGAAATVIALTTFTLAGGTVAAGPTGSCEWVDPGAVAALPAADAMGELGELTSFGAAIAAAGLDVDLEGRGPFTIFAPTNAAIDAIPQNVFDSLLADSDLLANFVGYHIVAGEQLSAADLAAAGTVEALSGVLTIAATGDELVVNGEAAVTCADIATADANVLVIDRFLQPPPVDAGCPPAGSSVPASSVPASSAPASSVPAGGPCPSPPPSSVPGDSVPGESTPVPASSVPG